MLDLERLQAAGFAPEQVTPMVPEDGLYLWDWLVFNKADETFSPTPKRITNKFVRCFRSVWTQIPERDRKTLKDHWHRPQAKHPRPLPEIEFNARMPLYTNATCDRLGITISFCIHHIDFSTAAKVRNTIAHEMGHAISYPHGWWDQHDHDVYSGQCVACELRAFSYMAAWGFDPFPFLPKRSRSLVERLTSRK